MNGVGSVTISGRTENGKYRDILEVADALRGRHGSATNAIAEMVRESNSYKQIRHSLSKIKKVPRGTDTDPRTGESPAEQDSNSQALSAGGA